jgi:hypothetical protein
MTIDSIFIEKTISMCISIPFVHSYEYTSKVSFLLIKNKLIQLDIIRASLI